MNQMPSVVKPLIPHKETYYVVLDNWTAQFVGPKDRRREWTWPSEPENAKQFEKKSYATKVIKELNKDFLKAGIPEKELDFRVCKVKVEYIRTVTILYKKK